MSHPYRITVTRPSIYFRLDRHLLCCRWRRRRWGERVLLSLICNHQRSDREIALNLWETKRWMRRSNRLIYPKVLCHCGNLKPRLPYILLNLRKRPFRRSGWVKQLHFRMRRSYLIRWEDVGVAVSMLSKLNFVWLVLYVGSRLVVWNCSGFYFLLTDVNQAL